MYAMTGLYAETGGAETEEAGPSTPPPPPPPHPPRDSIKCHSRNPSAGICDRYPHHNHRTTKCVLRKTCIRIHLVLSNINKGSVCLVLVTLFMSKTLNFVNYYCRTTQSIRTVYTENFEFSIVLFGNNG